MKIDTKIGGIALAVSVAAKADKQDELSKLGLMYLLFHRVPAVAFSKASGLKREGEHTAEREAQVVAATKTVLEKFFNVEGVEGSKPEAKVDKVSDAVSAERRKLHDSLKDILPADKLAEMFPEIYPAAEVVEEEEETAS